MREEGVALMRPEEEEVLKILVGEAILMKIGKEEVFFAGFEELQEELQLL